MILKHGKSQLDILYQIPNNIDALPATLRS
jgi:hypothetical protein